MQRLSLFIDWINEWVGRIVSGICAFMVVTVAVEVIARYFFSKPTIWVWDFNIQGLAIMTVLAGGYALLHGKHVTIGLVIERLSARTRAIIDLITSSVFFFGMAALLWLAIDDAMLSVQIDEHYSSLLRPPVYPLKIIITIGIFLLLIQGISKFVHDLNTAKKSSVEVGQ